MLLNPNVRVAVVETARGGILREGLGFDRCHVAIVTNIGQGDHLDLRGIDTLEDLARVKRTVVENVAAGRRRRAQRRRSPRGRDGRVIVPAASSSSPVMPHIRS